MRRRIDHVVHAKLCTEYGKFGGVAPVVEKLPRIADIGVERESELRPSQLTSHRRLVRIHRTLDLRGGLYWQVVPS